MFVAFFYIIIPAALEVFAVYSQEKLTTDISQENVEITAFVHGHDDSIRLNITLDSKFSSDSILDVLVENSDTESNCFHPSDYMYDINNHTVIFPSLNISNSVDNILLGCSYDVNITLEGHVLNYNYHVPDCIGNFCVCITNETNLIKLVNVRHVKEDIYRVQYTSCNTSLEKGNFYLTDVFYAEQNAVIPFSVPEFTYKKGEFEICMEYLKYGKNYTLYANYKDFDNLNPECEYTSYIYFTDISQEYVEITAFVYGNDSIRLNITLDSKFSSDSIFDVLVENSGTESNCIYPLDYMYHINNHTVIFPSLNIFNPVHNILPGCSYDVNITLEGHVLNYNYHVPDCIGNFCVCITNETNLIILVNVRHVKEDIYRVQYTSYNTSLEKGNFYLTEVFYDEQNADNSFEVPEFTYKKGEFEIRMEYLKDGENYRLSAHYKDFDNLNPECDYTSYMSFTAQVPSKSASRYLFKIAIIMSLLLFCSLILCGFLKWSKHSVKLTEELKKCLFPPVDEIQQNIETTTSFKCMHHEINTLYAPLELSVISSAKKSDVYEFPREKIVIKDVIGEGAFGKVYYAKAYELNGLPGYTMVAVKLLRGDAPKEEVADFQAEIKMLKKIGVHKNIVKLLACVTKSQPYMMVMELVSTGDLKEYLIKLREIWIKNKNRRLFFPDDMEKKIKKPTGPKTKIIRDKDTSDYIFPYGPDSDSSKLLLTEGITSFDVDTQTPLLSDVGGLPDPVLDHRELEKFALQIASGMAYLEKIPVTHRDLAARNILITKEKILKISDFGMSRTGPYVNRNTKKMPLRWMAIEAIEDFKTDNKSDVWSFGVVLWEIGTLGAFPYENIPNELIVKELKSGRRLPRPEICTDELFALMQRCWMDNPKDRPSFKELVEHFNVKKIHVYVDFCEINPKYVFPPTDPKC